MNQPLSSSDLGTHQRFWLRRSQITALLWLFALLTVCFAVPVAYSGIQYRRLVAKHHDKELAAEFPFTDEDGRGCHVFVFTPLFQGWPGTNPQTVVVTDRFFAELACTEVDDGESMFSAAAVERLDGAPCLKVTRVYRPMWGGIGTRRYKLAASGVSPSGDVCWDDPTYWRRQFDRLPGATIGAH